AYPADTDAAVTAAVIVKRKRLEVDCSVGSKRCLGCRRNKTAAAYALPIKMADASSNGNGSGTCWIVRLSRRPSRSGAMNMNGIIRRPNIKANAMLAPVFGFHE